MIPTQPGVYLHKNKKDEIIYIGKAKNLKKRVASYQRKQTHPKLITLQRNIHKTDFIITSNEIEALLLENQLIKKHQPRYNVLLKDGKRYAYIKVTKQNIPKIVVARKLNKKDKFFGPYTSSVRGTIHTINKVFKLRTCQTLPKRVCLNYHLKLCSGPCQNKISQTAYNQDVKKAMDLLKGNTDKYINVFKAQMQQYAKEQKYELAKDARDHMLGLLKLKQEQNVELQTRYNQDFIGVVGQDQQIAITIIKMSKGVITKKQDFKFDSEDNLLDTFIKIYYSQEKIPKEIVLPQRLNDKKIKSFLEKMRQGPVDITVPKKGNKMKLLNMAKQNAYAQFDTEDKILIELKEKLIMDQIPQTIECFDISNMGESNIVGSCVQFKDRKPFYKNYAHYNIRGNFGQDDFRSMHEVVKRRYSRFPLPELILIDGGHIQLKFAIKALQELNLMTTIIGLAKREETIVFPDGTEKRLNRKLASSRLLLQIRDATHNHVINFYRRKHKKSYKKSELDDIKGIGEKTKFKLLKEFKSIANMKKASEKELERIVGKKAKEIKESFSKN